MKIDYLFQGVTDKLSIAEKICKEFDITFDDVAYIGDDIGDIEFVKTLDIKYSGKTSQLIVDYPWKNEMLNKILNNDYKNLDGINFEETMKLVDDVYETKTFLKSKNITSKLRKKKKTIQRKMKVVNDDWNYFSKIYCIDKNNQMKKILFIQKFFSKCLWKINFIKKENAKPENKIKKFYDLIVKCLIKHVRNYVFLKRSELYLLFPCF